ncbi:M48 family metallopeptidase [Azohydromonas caseinilytica]|uniref:M48 family metallopeptidase n=1 Tax=Azohydromonas caseinilytica TaxID=2728836 RepID=A0A848F5J0_9BURK|nr:SprT family zinc-dependent metalloprotease [Azohydromonas caseinilytica]NML15327.1 M48 family metallopeptidase [Azohydromonas caseinilytica]
MSRRTAPVAPAAAPAGVPAPSLWRHPEARHAVTLPGGEVAYALRRSQRRSIGLVVDAQGLRVAAPRAATLAQVEQVLQAKAAWILRHLAAQQERALRRQEAQPVWGPQAPLPCLGRTLRLQAQAPAWRLDGELLHVPLPDEAPPAQWAAALRGWLQTRALEVFKERCALYAPRMGVRPARLALSAAATRWGSASAAGVIRLNWRLVHLAPALIDYVVVHELAHLREMNHSAAFWAHVRAVLPDFEQRRAALRAAVLPALE